MVIYDWYMWQRCTTLVIWYSVWLGDQVPFLWERFVGILFGGGRASIKMLKVAMAIQEGARNRNAQECEIDIKDDQKKNTKNEKNKHHKSRSRREERSRSRSRPWRPAERCSEQTKIGWWKIISRRTTSAYNGRNGGGWREKTLGCYLFHGHQAQGRATLPFFVAGVQQIDEVRQAATSAAPSSFVPDPVKFLDINAIDTFSDSNANAIGWRFFLFRNVFRWGIEPIHHGRREGLICSLKDRLGELGIWFRLLACLLPATKRASKHSECSCTWYVQSRNVCFVSDKRSL